MNIEQKLSELNVVTSNSYIKLYLPSTHDNSEVTDGKIHLFTLDGKEMIDKENMLKEIYSGLGLEEYLDFANFDGLEELLKPDLWPDLAAIHIKITSTTALLGCNNENDLKILFSIFQDTATLWNNTKHSQESFIVELWP
jgi:hypothetical protein